MIVGDLTFMLFLLKAVTGVGGSVRVDTALRADA